ncbi:MAG TPA: class I SAM-dependent methyltransferase [Terriglobales bacterium]|nr:class I SAM-dependent methyltransferase [Terriglobales bacterium]
MRRNTGQKIIDFLTFPLRAVSVFHEDKFGLSSLATERFDYVAEEVTGYCLDVGCGYRNKFVTAWLNGNGKGIDVFRYDGLTDEHIVEDMTQFPFSDESFDTVTFIANLNHVPEPDRDAELTEAYRCLKPGGKIVVTMGNPVAELAVHRVVAWHDRIFGTNVDMDSERGMGNEEAFYLLDSEIVDRLRRAGFSHLRKRYFLTQWGLNHLWVGLKMRQVAATASQGTNKLAATTPTRR